ncbi:hypothetical protein LB559_06495 [Mesorhizobium sp. BR1-1-3]|uniref:hypothetical protein n=1 Tax=unclassified Mesorhizobium TaxID=325217 RepID=UPI000F757482|nr:MULTISPECIES: hypothetical protein [unclassified Mesorhizobium]AZO45278.1 hypothetical protein EJ076_31345 [Mesorhizobium sp. M7D.F.Ca.US.005.01.1.1]MBZ9887588.1 hypothetical protein [Mesorhizobium sp. BR1-1-3]
MNIILLCPQPGLIAAASLGQRDPNPLFRKGLLDAGFNAYRRNSWHQRALNFRGRHRKIVETKPADHTGAALPEP